MLKYQEKLMTKDLINMNIVLKKIVNNTCRIRHIKPMPTFNEGLKV